MTKAGPSPRILVVDDDVDMARLVAVGVGAAGFVCHEVDTGVAALAALAAQPFDVVITDLQMRGMDGLELCGRITTNRPDIPVIVMTAHGSLAVAVAAIRAGAYDFITKPVDLETLAIAVNRAAQHRALREEVRLLQRTVEAARHFDDLLGASPAMQRLYDLLTRIQDSDASALIVGESGTGKELVARALHRKGRRSKAPFVAINCSALPEGLLESELFGHARGAFTDARGAHTGLFVKAHGGTLFLDEIGELPLALQPKLLRALEQRTVRPLGSSEEIAFDVRIVAATNLDLEAATEDKRFREDLYYRLNVVQIELPPLRDRGRDVLLLAQRFIEHFAAEAGKQVTGLSSAAAGQLLGYSWPGNVRELRNCIERAVALTRFQELAVEDLPEKIKVYPASTLIVAASDSSDLLPLEEVERRYILRVMEVLANNKRQAARVLGLDRKTLYRKLERYGIASPETDKG